MPRLDDPAEFALIKKIYFNNDDDYFLKETLDPYEKLERQESKQKYLNKTSR